MKAFYRTLILLLAVGGFMATSLMGVPTSLQAAETVDHSLFDELLSAYIKDGRVDYEGFKKEEQKLDQYLDLLDKTNPEVLSAEGDFKKELEANKDRIKVKYLDYDWSLNKVQ